MSTIQWIGENDLVLHWELNREKDESHVYGLMRHIDVGGYNADYPVGVIDIEGNLHVYAGHHRIAAAFGTHEDFPTLPLESVPCEIRAGDIDDVVRYMQLDHDKHNPSMNPALGLPLTRTQEREQRTIMLSFPENFKLTDRVLAAKWGRSHEWVRVVRGELSVKICQIHEEFHQNQLSARDLMEEHHFSESRLEAMYSLIRSGEREVTRGGTTYTQKTVASKEKRDAARDELAERQLENRETIETAVGAIAIRFSTLVDAEIRRRLYDAYGVSRRQEAHQWAIPALKNEVEAQESLLSMLSEEEDSAWMQEFGLTHHVRSDGDKLFQLQGEKDMMTEGAQRMVGDIERLRTPSWLLHSQDERLTKLKEMTEALEEVIATEENERREMANAEHDLRIASVNAVNACRDLEKSFQASDIEDTSQEGYEKFLDTALATRSYNSEVKANLKMLILAPLGLDNRLDVSLVESTVKLFLTDLESHREWTHPFFVSESGADVEDAVGDEDTPAEESPEPTPVAAQVSPEPTPVAAPAPTPAPAPVPDTSAAEVTAPSEKRRAATEVSEQFKQQVTREMTLGDGYDFQNFRKFVDIPQKRSDEKVNAAFNIAVDVFLYLMQSVDRDGSPLVGQVDVLSKIHNFALEDEEE